MKKEVRSRGIQARNDIDARTRRELSTEIAKNICRSEEYKRAEVIMLYKAIGGEVSLEALEEQAAKDGKKLAYPLCVSKTQMVTLCPRSEKAWEKGSYGIMEPREEESDYVPPENISLIICPCTAFDRECRRMGMGGGYYDRFLPLCRNACIAAAAFEVQKTGKVPADKYDVPMQKIFTEKKIYTRVF